MNLHLEGLAMTALDVQRLLKRRPFQPLRFHFLEGESRDVKHPELVWVAGGSLFFGDGMIKDNVIVAEELGPIYAVNMIKKVEVLETVSEKTDQNGS
jgi:hypothetical protein